MFGLRNRRSAVAAHFANLTPIVAWVSYLDVYGFKSIIRNAELTNDQVKLFTSLSSIHSEMAEYIHRDTIVFTLSDSYFLVNPVRNDPISAYNNCLADIRTAIRLHIDHDLPLRGGVAYGPVSISTNVLIGSAVVRAATYERLSRIPLVMLPQRELELASIEIESSSFVDHQVVDETNRSGIVSSTFVVPVNARTYIDFCHNKSGFYRVHGPEKVAKDWLEVVQVLSKLVRNDPPKAT
jgi:hypothetical protein